MNPWKNKQKMGDHGVNTLCINSWSNFCRALFSPVRHIAHSRPETSVCPKSRYPDGK